MSEFKSSKNIHKHPTPLLLSEFETLDTNNFSWSHIKKDLEHISTKNSIATSGSQNQKDKKQSSVTKRSPFKQRIVYKKT